MLDSTKTDPKLGAKVDTHLRHLNLQTPMQSMFSLPDHDMLEHHFKAIVALLGLDCSDDSIRETPRRLAKMFGRELTWGLSPANFPKFMVVENKMKYDEMLVDSGISVMSLCEHHFQPIEGHCTVGYFPGSKVAGLSKFNRVVEYFSRRPQVQERLTSQIFETLKCLLETEDVAVTITAKHYCVIARGVEDHNSLTTTSAMGGRFRLPNVKAEFLALSRNS